MKIYFLWFMVVFAYFLGSVPFGYLIGRLKGVDLRKEGSGNIGATNVGRILGKQWAYLCFALDVLKSLVPMLIAKNFISIPATTNEMFLWLGVGFAAIVGHIFPVYLGFKGGKGVATSLGMVLGLWPYLSIPGLLSFGIWCVVFLVWRYVSLASISAAVSFPAILLTSIIVGKDDWNFKSLWPLVFVAILIAGLVVIRHRENIKRLLSGSENKAAAKDSSTDET